MNIKEVKQIVSDAIMTTAGIVGFEELLESEINVKNNNGLVVEYDSNNENIINVTIGLLILSNISAKNTVEEIYQNITHFLKKESLFLGSLSVYIKGTK
ncbi:hypothetical protein [Metamycoplasma equirhinis]|uniref:hypothetical protein n=1 Tax=Metamycoplasma equirhinis TaxID=92402 RepID=UPI0035942932